MRTLENKQLTKNFWLYEFIEGELPFEAVKLNWMDIDDFSEERCRMLAELLQKKRDHVNEVFRKKNNGKEIKLRLLSGFRCLAWERIKKRDGSSQHVLSWAGDIQPYNCSDELAIEIINYLKDIEYGPGGHKGGFAIKEPTYDEGKLIKIGFAHYDMRAVHDRWTYKN